MNTLQQGKPIVAHPAEEAALEAVARIIQAFSGSELPEFSWEGNDIGNFALDYALAGWEVFPLSNGKLPYFGSHGVLDASSDLRTVGAWWSGKGYPAGYSWIPKANSNIGGRLPEGLVALDIDPRHGGLETLSALVEECGSKALETLTAYSGREDGGKHLLFFAPSGKLSSAKLNSWAQSKKVGQQDPKSNRWISGIDIKTRGGYLVLPPSIHAATGKPYRWENSEAPISEGSSALWKILLEDPKPIQEQRAPLKLDPLIHSSSPADAFTERATWHEILSPHGWTVTSGNGEEDSSKWKHSSADHSYSATIKRGCLFCYSGSFAPFANYITEGGAPKGLTKFRAFALLEFNGDLKAAARSLREVAK